MRASKGLLKGLNPTMAMTALTVITLFLLFGVFVPDTAAAWFVGAKDQIIAGFKWYYILVVALFLFFAIYLMFSRLAASGWVTTTRYRSSATSPGSPCSLARAWGSVWCSGVSLNPCTTCRAIRSLPKG